MFCSIYSVKLIYDVLQSPQLNYLTHIYLSLNKFKI